MTVGAALATPANALHFAVENGVFLLQEIIRIFLSFLRGHLIGAWLAMTNRGPPELSNLLRPMILRP
jgi:hypothetical protein